jgi:hypothetical protein
MSGEPVELEADLVPETQDGLLAVEIKNRAKVERRDATAIERARRHFGERYRGGIVVYRGLEIARLTETVFCVPDGVLLGA